MATPKTVTAGTSTWSEAIANKFISSDGTAVQVKVWHGHAVYNGADSVVDTAYDSAGFTTAGLAFNGTDTTFDFTLSGFSNPPAIVATAVGDSAYYPKVLSVTNVLARIAFYAIADGSRIATGTEDTDMDFFIIGIGF